MQNDDSLLPPMQVGQNAEESERLIEEIQNTGVIESQDAAQTTPSVSADETEDAESPTVPMPVITRN